MQNSELKKEILGQHSPVSAKELELYLKGELNPSEARSIEVKLSSNEFSSDAEDGFRTYGAEVGVSDIGAQWKTNDFSWFIWSGVGLAVIIGSFLVWNYSSRIESVRSNSSDVVTAQNSVGIDGQNQAEKEASLSPTLEKDGTSGQPSKASSKRSAEEAVSITPSEENLPVLFSSVIDKEVFTVKPIEKKEGNLLKEEEAASLKKQSVRLRHYKDYKLVDQGIGIDQSLLRPLLDGTPAFSERIIVNPIYPDWIPADSVYNASMNEAIDWIIAEEYKKAQFRLERFVQNNSDDLTATFYLGYALFLNDEFEEALVFLNKTQQHVIQTFDHDSRFLEIKCLLQLGRDDDAKKEAVYLKNANSFYAERAMELVNG